MKVFALRAVGLAVIALVLGAAPVGAQEHQPLGDAEIRAQIQHRLGEQGIRGVEVAVSRGAVTLTGTVRSAWAKQKAIDIARKADDVQSVTSELKVMRAERDTVIADQIATRVRQSVFYSIYDDIELSVKEGVVTLTGKVTMPYKGQQIAELASQVQGVQEVRNEIQTLPTSIHDDQIRYAVANQIYNDPMFWHYAVQSMPPIHIVVEHGRVTLTGVVNGEIEKRKAEILARSVFGVFEVRNELRVEKS
jgi:hyperosmotically inducible protein